MTEDRLEAVSELVDNPQLHQALKNSMPRFQDIELILSLCVQQVGYNYTNNKVYILIKICIWFLIKIITLMNKKDRINCNKKAWISLHILLCRVSRSNPLDL